MADHAATQTEHPWRAATRTFVQTVIPALIGLALIVPAILDVVLAGLGEFLPPEVRAALAGLALAISIVAATVARVMAMPVVVEWTKRWMPWLAPTSRSEEGQRA